MTDITSPSTTSTTIDGSGSATIGKGGVVTWNAKNGEESQVTIANQSGSNSLEVKVHGAPANIKTAGGAVFDGVHTIKVGASVFAKSNFKGATVTIANQSTNAVQCEVNVVLV